MNDIRLRKTSHELTFQQLRVQARFEVVNNGGTEHFYFRVVQSAVYPEYATTKTLSAFKVS